jgi:hypothetical protein
MIDFNELNDKILNIAYTLISAESTLLQITIGI